MRGDNRAKRQIRQSYAEYQRGKARKATDLLKELKKSMHKQGREK